jgi:flotillin
MYVNIQTVDWTMIISLALLFLAGLLLYLKVNLKICEPNEILVFSGKQRKLKSGEIVRYRVIRGGMGLRTPLMEKVSRLSLASIPIVMKIENALSDGMIPINCSAIAHAKIASKEGKGLESAVERLLGKSSVDIEAIARSTVEGVLRGVLATYTPEESNYRRTDLEKTVFEKASADLQGLGFTLDSIKIEEIKDTQGYLEAVGRQRNAVVKKDARIKEAEAEAEAKIIEATSKKRATEVEFKSQVAIEESESAFRNRKAELREKTLKLEAAAEYSKKIEELKQEDSLETIRNDVYLKKYNAEVVIPAEAEKKANELKATGKASFLKEQGIAMADAVKKMRSEWENGDNKELFMLHLLPNIVDSVSRVIGDNLEVDKLVITGNGALPSHVGDITSSVTAFLEQIKCTTGLDLTAILQGKKALPVSKELDH